MVWNIFHFFVIYGNFIIPTDFHIFQRGRYTTNHIYIYNHKTNQTYQTIRVSRNLGFAMMFSFYIRFLHDQHDPMFPFCKTLLRSMSTTTRWRLRSRWREEPPTKRRRHGENLGNALVFIGKSSSFMAARWRLVNNHLPRYWHRTSTWPFLDLWWW